LTADLSLIHLIANASFLVQLVMLALLLASVASWTLIFRKRALLRAARRAAEDFEERFWSGKDLVTLYNRITAKHYSPKGMEKIFEAGFREYARLRKQDLQPREVLEGTQRAMRVALSREMDQLEAHLSFLATVGSTSPYIGLFGTVWGIMNSFRALGNVHQATLAMVAPGIAEALIATAIGLMAAIPAVIAYNLFVQRIKVLASAMETFSSDFLNIIKRHVLK
jgi:biopolymer transport protein TolQ